MNDIELVVGRRKLRLKRLLLINARMTRIVSASERGSRD